MTPILDSLSQRQCQSEAADRWLGICHCFPDDLKFELVKDSQQDSELWSVDYPGAAPGGQEDTPGEVSTQS